MNITKNNYIVQIAIITDNPYIGDIAAAMYNQNIPIVNAKEFLDYWDNLDERAGVWNDEHTEYQYDSHITFTPQNIGMRYMEFYTDIFPEQMADKVYTQKTKLDNIAEATRQFHDGLINQSELLNFIDNAIQK